MLIDISVAFIAASFGVLVIFLIITLVKFNKTSSEINKLLHTTKRDLDELTAESTKLIKNLNETTNDVNRKLHSLDPIFRPFSEPKHNALATGIAECLSAGLVLFNNIKEGIKEYVKSR